MGNPTFIDSRQNEILLSHCTIATRMTKEFIIRNHYESGASIGLQGIMEKVRSPCSNAVENAWMNII